MPQPARAGRSLPIYIEPPRGDAVVIAVPWQRGAGHSQGFCVGGHVTTWLTSLAISTSLHETRDDQTGSVQAMDRNVWRLVGDEPGQRGATGFFDDHASDSPPDGHRAPTGKPQTCPDDPAPRTLSWILKSALEQWAPMRPGLEWLEDLFQWILTRARAGELTAVNWLGSIDGDPGLREPLDK